MVTWSKRLALGLAVQSLMVASAVADDGKDIELGAIQGFSSEGSARAACAPDVVVWADRKTGFFYPKFAEQYGKTANGVFTCYREADAADYWGFGPSSTMQGKGRTFPLIPGPVCDWQVNPKTGKGFCASPGT